MPLAHARLSGVRLLSLGVAMTLPKPVSTGLAVGIAVGAVFFLLSFFTVFGICSDTRIAETLFPYALISDPAIADRWWMALPLALIQYPIYGMVCGYVWMRKRSLLWLCVIGLLVTHMISANAASSRVKALHERIIQAR
jgi:hypothetical protein